MRWWVWYGLRGLTRREEQQIPPLRYGMEMQGAAGWILHSHPSQKRDGWGTPGVGGGWRNSRFLRFATEWKYKGRLVGFYIPTHRKSAMDGAPPAWVADGGAADSSASLRNGNTRGGLRPHLSDDHAVAKMGYPAKRGFPSGMTTKSGMRGFSGRSGRCGPSGRSW